MVESMSATSNRFARWSASWTTTSQPFQHSSAVRAAGISGIAKSTESPSSTQAWNAAPGTRSSASASSLSSSLPAAISVAMSKSRPPLIVIAGPTASGKSALALECAKAIGGSILNADASQLYSDIPILSAAPSKEERAAADHRLYAIRSGAEPFSAAEWASLARDEISSVHAFGGTPILVGGTGLYLRTLLDGIAPVPPIDPKVRAEVRSTKVAENREALAALDPEAAERLGPADTARIARALEVVRSTGRKLRDWHAMKTGGIGGDVSLRPIVLTPPRDWLYARCDARFKAMIELGAIAEVEALLAKNLDPELPVMRAIGIPEIAAFLRNEKDGEAMISEGQQATRRYAKRQYTWFKHQPPPEWPPFSEPLDSPNAMARALELLGAGR